MADGITRLIGLVTGPEAAERFAAAVQLERLTRSTFYTCILIAGLFAIIYTCERLTRANRVAYAGRTFRQDVLYALFYQGGFYHVLLWSALANAMQERLAFVRIDALATLPAVAHWAICLVAVDFTTYWWHRSLHAWGPLWAIHSVHHSQEEMSFISSYRAHPLEQVGQNIALMLPLLVLGFPTFRWLPLVAVMAFLEGAQHSALNWGYGRGYYLIVSPRFHALHHSRDPRHFNRNFSKILSVWDFIFGTATTDPRPTRFGVEGMPVPRTIGAQLLAPFRLLRERYAARGGPAAESASRA